MRLSVVFSLVCCFVSQVFAQEIFSIEDEYEIIDPAPVYKGCQYRELENGITIPKQDSYGMNAFVKYECSDGFTLNGMSSSGCVNGLWITDLPECLEIEKPKVYCKPPKFLRGTYSPSGVKKYSVGSTITFKCRSKYYMKGTDTAKCMPNGEWDQIPVCKVPCPEPSVSPKGYYKSQAAQSEYFEAGHVIYYFCQPGYVLRGAKSVKCRDNGKWNEPAPKCEIDGCTKQNIQHGKVTSGGASYSVNAVISLSCDVGYYAIGQSSAKCMPNGQWDAQLRCADGCIAPRIKYMQLSPAPASGGNVYEIGHRIRFKCDVGYSSGTAREAECRGGNKWDRILPKCSILTARTGCPKPYLSEGLVLLTPKQYIYPYKAELEFECLPGFNMVGSAVSICRKGHGLKGGLDPLPPVCVRVECGAPGTPQNGKILGGIKKSYVYGDVVYFKCDSKNIMSGSDHITCQADGQFDGKPPICQPPSCKVECKYVKKRKCQCDALCRERRDCCYDFEQHCRKLFY
uniref:complement receptor type 2-like n=1 Tax=Styela clava TaxID=7725 RepID=UPI0019398E30|nr:complement receptor type 2-like [Styela clava]